MCSISPAKPAEDPPKPKPAPTPEEKLAAHFNMSIEQLQQILNRRGVYKTDRLG